MDQSSQQITNPFSRIIHIVAKKSRTDFSLLKILRDKLLNYKIAFSKPKSFA